MPIDRPPLEAAIKASGGAQQPDDQVEGLLAKLTLLEKTGRYAVLVKSLAYANDKNNFLTLLQETSFAFQFEDAGMPLAYEVTQVARQTSSIDFKLDAQTGEALYFELRLLQQDAKTAEDITQQLQTSLGYKVQKDGRAEQADIFRLQSTILSKVQNANGTPIKFLKTGEGVVNIVVCVHLRHFANDGRCVRLHADDVRRP